MFDHEIFMDIWADYIIDLFLPNWIWDAWERQARIDWVDVKNELYVSWLFLLMCHLIILMSLGLILMLLNFLCLVITVRYTITIPFDVHVCCKSACLQNGIMSVRSRVGQIVAIIKTYTHIDTFRHTHINTLDWNDLPKNGMTSMKFPSFQFTHADASRRIV